MEGKRCLCTENLKIHIEPHQHHIRTHHRIICHVVRCNMSCMYSALYTLTYFSSIIRWISWKTLPKSSLTSALLKTWVFLNIFRCPLEIWMESKETVLALVASLRASVAVDDEPDDSEDNLQ